MVIFIHKCDKTDETIKIMNMNAREYERNEE